MAFKLKAQVVAESYREDSPSTLGDDLYTFWCQAESLRQRAEQDNSDGYYTARYFAGRKSAFADACRWYARHAKEGTLQ